VRFFPKQVDFFEIFERASRNLIVACEHLVGLFENFERIDERIAAIEKLDYTPATILTDAPLVFRDEESSWKPKNYGEDFKGDVTLRTALVNSMNIPAVKTAEALAAKFGMQALADWAKGLGLTTPVKLELGSALGSSCARVSRFRSLYW